MGFLWGFFCFFFLGGGGGLFFSFHKTYVVGTQKNHLTVMVLLSTKTYVINTCKNIFTILRSIFLPSVV